VSLGRKTGAFLLWPVCDVKAQAAFFHLTEDWGNTTACGGVVQSEKSPALDVLRYLLFCLAAFFATSEWPFDM
jgi:hypothetical protein